MKTLSCTFIAMKPSDIPFQTLCSFFNVCQQKMTPTLRHKHLRHFREKFIERTGEDVFSIYRLMAPAVRAGTIHEPIRTVLSALRTLR